MFEAIFMGKTGLINHQKRMDTVADNLANVNTVGYKTGRMDFKDAIYTTWYGNTYDGNDQDNYQHGHGVMVNAVNKDFYNNGSIQTTGNQLDFCLEGEGFFELVDHEGNRVYSRQGTFYVSVEDGRNMLVNSNGYYVQNANGEDIEIPQGTTIVSASEDGAITFQTPDGSYNDRFGLYTFTNKTGLESLGGTNYGRTEASGQMTAAPESTRIHQGSVEMSNVSLAAEMTRIIRAQRAFSLSSRCVTVADDMEGVANNMKK